MKYVKRKIRAWLGRVHGDLPVYGMWGILLLAIETLGRRSRHEAVDLFCVSLIGAGLLVTALFRPGMLKSAAGLFGRLMRPLKRYKVKWGIDFREVPPLPRRLPPQCWVVLSLAAGVLVPLALGRAWFPTGFRKALVVVSPTLNAIYLLMLWSFLGITMVGLVLVSVVVIREVRRLHGKSVEVSSSWLGVRVVGCAILVFVLASLVDARWAILAILTIGCTYILFNLLLPVRELVVAWRSPGIGDETYSARLPVLGTIVCLVIGALVLILGLLACGDALRHSAPLEEVPITRFLGYLFLWAAALSVAVFSLTQTQARWISSKDDPRVARAHALVLRTGSDASWPDDAVQAIKAVGFDVVRDGNQTGSSVAVPVEFGEVAASSEFQPGPWFRRVTRSEIADPQLHDALRSRSRLMRRRVVRRGIERALQRARRRTYKKGGGYWIGLHLWFLSHLTRDEDEDDNILGALGRPWRNLIPQPGRHAFYSMMTALQIDLIFVEDGVRPRDFSRVLQQLFEYEDTLGGKPLSSHEGFPGIPRVRVILHEFSLGGDSLSDKRYPEPDYEEVGRARILHVFRDRGGDVTPVDSPVESDLLPAPVLVG